MCTEFLVFKNFLYGPVFMAEGYVDGACSSELVVFVDIECVCIAEVHVELFLYLVCKNVYSCTDNGSCDLVFLKEFDEFFCSFHDWHIVIDGLDFL